MYEKWINFFLKAIIIATEETINVVNKIEELRQKNDAKIISLDKSVKNAALLYEYIKKNPIFEIKDISHALNISFNTASKMIDCLQRIEIIDQSNSLMRRRVFIYRDYLKILYPENFMIHNVEK